MRPSLGTWNFGIRMGSGIEPILARSAAHTTRAWKGRIWPSESERRRQGEFDFRSAPGSLPVGAVSDRSAAGDGLDLDEIEHTFPSSFTAQSGLFHSSEGRFGSGPGAGVVTDMAVAEPRNDPLGARVVFREEIGGKTELRIVREPDRLFLVLELEEREERTERLLARAQHSRTRSAHDRGRKEPASGARTHPGLRGDRRHVAAEHRPRSLGERIFEMAIHLLVTGSIDHRSDRNAFLHPVADAERLEPRDERALELV